MIDNNIEGFNEVDELGTIIYIAKDNTYKGYIVISDEIKESSKKLIDLLAKNGIKNDMTDKNMFLKLMLKQLNKLKKWVLV